MVCVVHGAGARERWRPVVRFEAGVRVCDREYYYECDLGPNGRRQRQTRLSFVRTTTEDNPQDNTHHEDNTSQGDLGQ